MSQARAEEAAERPERPDSGLHRIASGQASVIALLDGSSARLEGDEEGREVLRLRDREGTLLLEHRPGETVICAPRGDLRLSAPEGDVHIQSGGRIALEAEAGLDLRARHGDREAHLRLTPSSLKIKAEHLRAQSQSAEGLFERARLFATALHTVAKEIEIKARRFELRSERILEHARDVYREAEDLSQTRAGRLKLIANKSLQALAEELRLKANKSARVEGEKIYLG